MSNHYSAPSINVERKPFSNHYFAPLFSTIVEKSNRQKNTKTRKMAQDNSEVPETIIIQDDSVLDDVSEFGESDIPDVDSDEEGVVVIDEVMAAHDQGIFYS